MITDGGVTTSLLSQRVEAAYNSMMRDYPRLDRIDHYARGHHASPFIPRRANPEYRDLAKRAINNLIPLIIDAPVNNMAVEGYVRGKNKKDLPPEWDDWIRNRLDERQSHVHRAALEAGHAYVTVLPDTDNPGFSKVRAYHAMNFMAHYTDPACDEFPLYGLFVETPEVFELPHSDTGDPVKAVFIDSTAVHELELSSGKIKRVVSRREHHMPVCPVVRFAPSLDVRGRSIGFVEPIIPAQDRVNQISLNKLVAQHWTSFAIRYATGLAPVPLLDVNGNEQFDQDGRLKVVPPVVDPSTMLISPDPQTKFGQIDGASTSDMQSAEEQAIRHMCMVTQTPPTYLLGQMANLSADALAAAESAFSRRISEIQSNFGEGWASVLRLCAWNKNDSTGYEDVDSIVMWADKGNRSLAQSADAGLKLTQMGVPAEIVLRKMPGFSQTDIEEAVKLMEKAKDQEAVDKLTMALNGGGVSDGTDGDKALVHNAAAKKPTQQA